MPEQAGKDGRRFCFFRFFHYYYKINRLTEVFKLFRDKFSYEKPLPNYFRVGFLDFLRMLLFSRKPRRR